MQTLQQPTAADLREIDTTPTRDMDGSYFVAEPTAEELASYAAWQANGGANDTPTERSHEDMQADDKAQTLADAIVRLMGLDTLVADDEFDAEVGRKYFLGD